MVLFNLTCSASDLSYAVFQKAILSKNFSEYKFSKDFDLEINFRIFKMYSALVNYCTVLM